MKVYIDPACNILYSSFYIQGLRELYGYSNIVFSSKPFKNLYYDNDNFLLAFVINNVKYIIDFSDFNTIKYNNFLDWANVYGKVNYNLDKIPLKYRNKIIPIGANFGIACYGNNREINILWALKHYLQCRNRLEYSWKSYLCRYLTLYKRKIYQNQIIPSNNYIFFVSRYWEGQDTANEYRINFIRACKRLQNEGLINFEGGMVPDKKTSLCPKDVLIDKEIPFNKYIQGIKTSAIVFNTPAYHKCHGWKLPEYISQGAVILSTPFHNELPFPLMHNENIFFSNSDEKSLYESIKALLSNIDLHNKIKKNIKEYWCNYACPKSCIEQFINNKQNI